MSAYIALSTGGLLIAVLGSWFFMASQAASSTVSLEPEQGTVSGSATTTKDTAASGGAAIAFNTAAVRNLIIPANGALLGTSTSASTASSIDSLETAMGRHLDVDVNFWSFTSGTASNISQSTLDDDATNTRVPLVTWQPQLSGSDADIMPDITAGKYDAYITNVADQLRDYNKPVFLRYAHEMNGNWYSWSGCQNGCSKAGAQAYVAAWRHTYNIFQKQGALNVLWMWCTASTDIPGGQTGHHWTDYYPGDAYVDWVSYDHYISPGSYKATGSGGLPTAADIQASWTSSENKSLMDGMHTSAETIYSDYNLADGSLGKKPIFIAETMNGPDLDDNINQLIYDKKLDVSSYDKTKYFSSVVSDIKDFSGIKGVAFFDHYTNGSGNAHDYCVNEQDCHPQQWNSKTLPTPNATSSTANFNAFLVMAKDCYFDSHKRQGACH